jgi:hypothetical protein
MADTDTSSINFTDLINATKAQALNMSALAQALQVLADTLIALS